MNLLVLIAIVLVAFVAVHCVYAYNESFQIPSTALACPPVSITVSSKSYDWQSIIKGEVNEFIYSTQNIGAINNWWLLLNSLIQNSCWKGVMGFYVWAMYYNTLMFPPNTISAYYMDNEDLNDRYMNFVWQLVEYPLLRIPTTSPLLPLTIPNLQYQQNLGPSFNQTTTMFGIMRLLIQFYLARDGMVAIDQNAGTKVHYIGLWLDRVQQFHSIILNFTRTAVININSGIQFLIRMINQMLGANASIPGPVQNSDGLTAALNFCRYITGFKALSEALRNPTFSTASTYVNRIPGFIYDAANDRTSCIDDHVAYLAVIQFGLFCVKSLYGTRVVTGNFGEVTYTTPTAVNDILNTVIQPIIHQIVRNVNADQYLEMEVAKLKMPIEEVDIALRNYLGKDSCIQPISIDNIITELNNTQRVNTLTATAIPTLGSTIGEIGTALRKIIFYTNLDRNNKTNAPMPNVNALETKRLRMKHVEMFMYLFNNSDLPADYLNNFDMINVVTFGVLQVPLDKLKVALESWAAVRTTLSQPNLPALPPASA